ncbi:unnamed protein product [Closterium sp. NIES-53]
MTGSSNSTEWMWGGDGDFCDEEFADHSDRSGRTGYYSGDEEQAPWRGQAETAMTKHGPLRVTVCGNRSLPPLLTYHDIGLNRERPFVPFSSRNFASPAFLFSLPSKKSILFPSRIRLPVNSLHHATISPLASQFAPISHLIPAPISSLSITPPHPAARPKPPDSTCFEGLMLCPDTAHLLLGNFCVYHIDAPGHEAGAEEISPLEAQLTASDLAEQVAEVMAWFRLPPAVCIGVGAGAYVLTLLAVSPASCSRLVPPAPFPAASFLFRLSRPISLPVPCTPLTGILSSPLPHLLLALPLPPRSFPPSSPFRRGPHQLERPQAVQSLVLVSPVCRAASWGEWARSKVLLGVLCVAGMSKYVKDALVHRYFCHQQTGFHGPASDSILMFRQYRQDNMCRPPDLLPQAANFQQQPAGASAIRGGGYDLARAAAALARGSVAPPATGLPIYSRAPGAAIGSVSVSGRNGSLLAAPQLPLKRPLASCAGPQLMSPFQVPAKIMRQTASVSSEFDNAASNFIARMEQSVIEDIKKQQQQQQQQKLLEYLSQSQQLSGRAVPFPAPTPPPSSAMDSWIRAAAGISGVSATGNSSALPGPLDRAVTGLPAASMLSAASVAAAMPATVSGVPFLPLAAQLAPSAPSNPTLGAGDFASTLMGVEVETEEKKTKRIMSNRASAKRSRQRRQERLEELERETEVLHADHAQVVAKLGRATQQMSRLEMENSRLMAELAALRKAAASAGIPLSLEDDAAATAAGAAGESAEKGNSAGSSNGSSNSGGRADELKNAPAPSVFVDLLPVNQLETTPEEAGIAAAAAAAAKAETGVVMKGAFAFEQGSPESAVTDWSNEQQESQAAAAGAAGAEGEGEDFAGLLLGGLDCGGIGGIMEDELFSSLLSCFDATA